MSFYTFMGLPQPNTFSRYTTSWLLPPLALALLRLLFSIYAFITIFFSFAWYAHHADTFYIKDIDLPAISFILGANAIARSFSYFTYLSYWGLAFYFFTSSLHTFYYASRGRTLLERFPRSLQLAHALFYTSVTTFPLMVSIIYWGSMFTLTWYPEPFDRWSNLSIHALNSVFALTEIILPRTQAPKWTHLSVLMGIMSLYLALVYVSYAVEGFYPYEWVDPRMGWRQIIAHIAGYTTVIVGVFLGSCGGIWVRGRLMEWNEGGHQLVRLDSQATLRGEALGEDVGLRLEEEDEEVEKVGLAVTGLEPPPPIWQAGWASPRWSVDSDSSGVRNFSRPDYRAGYRCSGQEREMQWV